MKGILMDSFVEGKEGKRWSQANEGLFPSRREVRL